MKESVRLRVSKFLRRVAAAIVASGTAAAPLRSRQGDAGLDFRKAKVPSFKTAQRLTLQGTTTCVGEDDLTATRQSNANTQPSEDYQAVETRSLVEYKGVLIVSEVQEQVTKRDTGITFRLAESGLYVIRRPLMETDNEVRERNRRLDYAGGAG